MKKGIPERVSSLQRAYWKCRGFMHCLFIRNLGETQTIPVVVTSLGFLGVVFNNADHENGQFED